MTLLRLSNLSLSIGDTPILRDVSLDIAPGEVFGLVGESGSGKSMTSLAVMGLLPEGARVTGSALLTTGTKAGGGGSMPPTTAPPVDLLTLSESHMCAIRGNQIGMIFQEPMTALNPVRPIGEQVAETLVVHGAASRAEAMDVARERLARVGLTADRFPLTRYPHELSGGQRQRVCIAMAVALRPRLLIADEPTTALDVTTQAQILDLLKGLVEEEGMSLLLITHDLAVVANVADRVAVMQAGRIVEQGRTEALFRTRSHDYTRRLFAASSHQPERTAPAPGTPLLEVRGAVREYVLPRRQLFGLPPTLRAVDRVDLTLRRGESLGLVGESGCGKSTLTRAILGLEPLQAGSISLDGSAVAQGMPAHQRAQIQVVFQDPYGSFNPRHRVERLVAEPFNLSPAPTAERRDRVAAALEDVGLAPSDMEKFVHEFSGGQRQRIAIARALIIRPQIIVLDEAVSALDVRVRAQILDLLADLQARHGLSYLFISHDLSVVRSITDRVMVMKSGRIVEEGPTRTVFDAPTQDYTRTLIRATPMIPPEWVPDERKTT